MFKKIIEIDKSLFLLINQKSRNGFFDAWMPFLREPKIWAPLYLFVLLFVIINFPKKALGFIFAALVTFLSTETISSKIFKPLFARSRPCMDSDFSSQVRLLASYCGGNGSFTSSHATNHFGLAMFFFITLQHIWPKTIYLFFLWAASVCFAQIYVGVHYPTDVIVGGIIGSIVGYFTGRFFNNQFGKLG